MRYSLVFSGVLFGLLYAEEESEPVPVALPTPVPKTSEAPKTPEAVKPGSKTPTPVDPGKAKSQKLSSDNCSAICGTIAECLTSQLKSTCLNDNTCLGLYQRPNKNLCYQLGSVDTCGNGEKSPVSCSAVISTTTPMPDPCEFWCSEVGCCDGSPEKSYCQADGTCFGLYDRIGLKRCYAYFGMGCGSGRPWLPVSCSVYISTTTLDPCVTTTTADPCSTTPDPSHTTTRDPCETTTTHDPCDTTTSTSPSPVPVKKQKPALPVVAQTALTPEQQAEAFRWYTAQMAAQKEISSFGQKPVFMQGPVHNQAGSWTQGLSPSYFKKPALKQDFDVCQVHCKANSLCARFGLKYTRCQGGQCSNILVNSNGTTCYKHSVEACATPDFFPLPC